MPWWGWLLVGVALIVLVVSALRRQIRRLLRLAQAVAKDPRIPRPLRWGLTVALAIKAIPVPDFGVDEILLLVIGLVLVTFYRATLREIVAESR